MKEKLAPYEELMFEPFDPKTKKVTAIIKREPPESDIVEGCP